MIKVATGGRGVLLPELRLALDVDAPGHDIVVSHAHGDHVPWGARRAYASRETADLLALRYPELQVETLPWREPVRIGAAKVTLYPSGHILGAALTHVEAPDGSTLLYTADTKDVPGVSCAPAEFVEADALIVESTFGLPIFRFPSRDAVADRAVAFARETLAAGQTPVFLGYALGKSQEIMRLLGDAGVPVVAHGAAWRLCEAYRAHGVDFPRARPYVRGETEGAALVVPGSFRNHAMVNALDARIAYCSGWALLSRSRQQNDADLLLPLSDHADYRGLLSIVDAVRPKRVYANHGYADVFAHLLRKRGHDAAALAVGHLEEDLDPTAAAAAAPPDDAQRRLEA